MPSAAPTRRTLTHSGYKAAARGREKPRADSREKVVETTFVALVCLVLLTPLVTFNDLLYPTVTSKAYYLRILVEIAFPLYLYLILANPNRRPSARNPISVSIFAFFLANCIAAALSVNVFRSVWGDLQRMSGVFHLAHLVLLYFYVLLLAQIGKRRLRQFSIAIVLAGAAVSVWGILIRVTNNHFLAPDASYPRISATLGNPIFLAGFLVIPFFLALYSIVETDRAGWRLLYACISLADLACILLTQTRGAIAAVLLGLCGAAAVYVLASGKRTIRLCVISALLAIVLLTSAALIYKDTFAPHSLASRILNLQDDSAKARLILWRTSLNSLKDCWLFGSGPETFYSAGAKYYDRAAYGYDPNWWDKPHNAFLEAVVTTGYAGIGTYLALLGAAAWVLFAAWAKQKLTLPGFCLLLAGIVAYQLQDFFIFETPAATLTLYCLLGFVSSFWVATRKPASDSDVRVAVGRTRPAIVAAVVAGLIMIVLYGATVPSIRLARDISFGGRYGLALQGQKAVDYFEAAGRLPINFDPLELAGKYSEFAVKFALAGQDADLAKRVLERAIDVQKDALRHVPDHAPSWQRLSGLYVTEARITGRTSLLDASEDAIQRAIRLAPNRPESRMVLVRLKLYRNDRQGAQELLGRILRDFPTDAEAEMQAALLARDAGRMDEAVRMAQDGMRHGFIPQQGREVVWLGAYYEQMGNPSGAAAIYRIAIKAEPGNASYYWKLAQMYYQMGNKYAAKQAAEAVAFLDPGQTRAVSEFVTQLQSTY